MNKKSVFKCFTGSCLIATLILADNGPGFCQDLINSYPLGPGFHLPITRALTEMPMPISFNGISSSDTYSCNLDKAGKNNGHKDGFGTGVRLSMQAAGINASLARIRSRLSEYIRVAGPDVKGVSDLPEALNSGTGKDTGDITLEFQADITDMSGALFFVMKI